MGLSTVPKGRMFSSILNLKLRIFANEIHTNLEGTKMTNLVKGRIKLVR